MVDMTFYVGKIVMLVSIILFMSLKINEKYFRLTVSTFRWAPAAASRRAPRVRARARTRSVSLCASTTAGS